jgi:hypothetical protein
LATACTSSEPAPLQSCSDELRAGDPNGHGDPFGAKAAKQARAGRVFDGAAIAQPAHGRQRIKTGDYVLANDRIAVVIQGPGLRDGYGRFGGGIVTIDQLGDDGKPLGRSRFLETMACVGGMLPKVRSVSVLRDGSDGGEAVVRAIGRLATIDYLAGSIANLLKTDYDLDVAYDYVLKPGWEKVRLRMSVRNESPEPIDFGVERPGNDMLYGFFQTNHNLVASAASGFAPLPNSSPWIGFVGGPAPKDVDAAGWNFAWRAVGGDMTTEIQLGSFYMFTGPAFVADACSVTSFDRAELIGGGPEYDGLREAIRRDSGEPAWRAISGAVTEAGGIAVAGALVHELDSSGGHLSRARCDAMGRFTLHAPAGKSVRLVATAPGYVHGGSDVSASTSDVTLAFEPSARIHVTAEDGQGTAMPVRIQVIPEKPPASVPPSFGLEQEVNGRLHQIFDPKGDTTLVVSPGKNRVIVTRGYEYELHDQTLVLAAGDVAEVKAKLIRSVDSTGVMCGDFHIHTQQSVDATDPVDYKVLGAVADGLEIPCSSDHEWVVDFAPVVKKLGLQKWAFGMSSSELSTVSFGHFGVIPLLPRPDAYNNGAIDWVGRTPAETFAAVDALPEKPALVVNHPRKTSIGGYFSTAKLDPMTGMSQNPEMWSENFDAVEVFNDQSFDQTRNTVRDWMSLLMRGKRVFAIGNSDSHKLRTNPVGYPRTCFHFGHDDPEKLTGSAVRDALLSGNSIVSGGLFMTVLGPNGVRPGGSVPAGSTSFTVTVEAPSWIAASELEILVDGATVKTEPLTPQGAGPSKRYVNQVTLDLTGKRFVVFHARSGQDLAPLHPGKQAFAASNPIFVK